MELLKQDRRTPRQQRSLAKVTRILDATAEVLLEHGYAGLSTNRIAVVAGISVGAIYQYFPNKTALIENLREKLAADDRLLLEEQFAAARDKDLQDAIRFMVRTLVASHKQHIALRRVLIEQAPKSGDRRWMVEMDQAIHKAIQQQLKLHQDEIVVKDIRLAAYLIMQLVDAAVSSSLHDEFKWVGTKKLEQELFCAITRYLGIAIAEQV